MCTFYMCTFYMCTFYMCTFYMFIFLLGVITPFGHLLRVSGGSRTVEILHVKTLMKDLPEYQELESFPGPLIRGRTHKNTVIKFCQKKIKAIQNHDFQADKENLILLWELLILLIRQNGVSTN